MKIEDTRKFFQSIIEREIIFIRKELQGCPRHQWTNVQVYKNYRFCNVHRCYDKTFILIDILEKKLLEHKLGSLHPGLRTVLRWSASNDLIQWLIDNLAYNTSIAEELELANTGKPERLFASILDAYHNGVIHLVTGSFIVKRYGNDYEEMLAYYRVGSQFYAKMIQSSETIKSKDAVKFFKDNAPWCADFGAYCIVSDWLYLIPDKFSDKYEWTAYGPGAFNGINLIESTTKTTYLDRLRMLHTIWWTNGKELVAKVLAETGLSYEGLDDLCIRKGFYPMTKLLEKPLMLDVEHWLCEYAKYCRGWAKKKYVRN